MPIISPTPRNGQSTEKNKHRSEYTVKPPVVSMLDSGLLLLTSVLEITGCTLPNLSPSPCGSFGTLRFLFWLFKAKRTSLLSIYVLFS